jgi:Sec-independent protein secretion pathway component TatC
MIVLYELSVILAALFERRSRRTQSADVNKVNRLS